MKSLDTKPRKSKEIQKKSKEIQAQTKRIQGNSRHSKEIQAPGRIQTRARLRVCLQAAASRSPLLTPTKLRAVVPAHVKRLGLIGELLLRKRAWARWSGQPS